MTAATLRLWLPNYERWEARSKRKIALTPELRAKLVRISPATIDRLLRAEKRKLTLRGHSHTKRPTGSLMLQIPIRTFSEWEGVPLGTLGLDLVGHDGGTTSGEFAFTLLATDRRSQWTEFRAVPNKAQKWVFQQLLVVRHLLPFELLAVHSDNGGEFIMGVPRFGGQVTTEGGGVVHGRLRCIRLVVNPRLHDASQDSTANKWWR